MRDESRAAGRSGRVPLTAEAHPTARRALTNAELLRLARSLHAGAATAAALRQAEHAYRQALRHVPDDPAARNDLGTVLAALGRPEEEAVEFAAACELDPNFAITFSNLGNALVAQRRYVQAVACYRVAIARDPALAEAEGNLGAALLELHHPQDAMAHLNRAAALDPALPEVDNSRGQALLMLGDLPAARAAFRRAASLKPERASFYAGIAATEPLGGEDQRFLHLVEMARSADAMPPAEQVALHFALHRAYEFQKRYDLAWAHLQRGNELRRAVMAYDEAAPAALMAEIKRNYSQALLAGAPARLGAADVPIFILGMPRSGSTLIEQILSSHRGVAAVGGPALGEVAKLARDFAAAGAAYRARLQALKPGAARITYKMYANFHHVRLIRMALPNARVTHTRRDPLETCFSCLAQSFSKGIPYVNEAGRWRATIACMRI